MKSDPIRMNQIPRPLYDEIGSDLELHLVALAGVDESSPTPRLVPAGSGTLVRIDAHHYVLTAGHVWAEVLAGFPMVAISAREDGVVTIPRDALTSKWMWYETAPEWGPDLALLQLAPSDAKRLERRKVFLNLREHRNRWLIDPLEVDWGVWAVTGMLGNLSIVTQVPEQRMIHAEIQVRAFFSGVDAQHERDGYDYLDLGVDRTDAPVQELVAREGDTTFGGMSGGGLWQIPIHRDATGAIVWDGAKHLRGVAFWESAPHDRRQEIRGHGPRSLFERVWKEWKLPE